MERQENNEEVILRGIAASPGVAHGPAFVLDQHALEIPAHVVATDHVKEEVARFEHALVQTRQQIMAIRGQIAIRLSEEEAQIFDAHLLVLEDKALIDETIREVEQSRHNVAYVFNEVSSRYIDAFLKIDDEYIKERVSDIRDVSRRLLNNLLGMTNQAFTAFAEPKVLVSDDLTPSETAGLNKEKVLAMVTNAGGRTSHVSIMARSLEVPAVVGLHDITPRVEIGTPILVDGYEGIVIIHPTEQTLYRYGKMRLRRESIQGVYRRSARDLAVTLDQHRVFVSANIEGTEDGEGLRRHGADGVGLFRTEMIYLRDRIFPPEEEQFRHYQMIVEAMGARPVTIRTWDLGGDKTLGATGDFKEANPFMGYRAIRFCLENEALFKDQMRAIIRASAFGAARILFPMVSGVEELKRARELFEEARDEVRQRGEAQAEKIPVGCMIEIPSAAWIMDHLSAHCDFFSIGTNDLIQYMMAVDRVNDRIAHLYEPCHPAVLRSLKAISEAARKFERPLSICGEVAGEPTFVPLLLGLGVTELSVAPGVIPEIKYLVRNVRLEDCRTLAAEVLANADAVVTRGRLQQFRDRHLDTALRVEIGENGHDNGNGHREEAETGSRVGAPASSRTEGN